MLAVLAKRKKSPKKLIVILLLLLLLLAGIYYCWRHFAHPQVWRTIGGERQLIALLKRTTHQREVFFHHPLTLALILPCIIPVAILSFLFNFFFSPRYGYDYFAVDSPKTEPREIRAFANEASERPPSSLELDTTSMRKASDDYATTNLQVAEVDEADIIKTDGNYIYSLSGEQVIITDVRQPQAPKIISRLNLSDGGAVEDLLLADKFLIIIGTNSRSKLGTIVNIYDLSEHAQPQLVRQLSFRQRYFTSRIADNKLYLLAKDYLSYRDTGEHLVYNDNHQQLKITDDKLYYLPHHLTNYLSIIATLDLTALEKPLQLRGLLLDLDEAYVSRNHLYLVTQDDEKNIYSWQQFSQATKALFSWRGVWALLDEDFSIDYSTFTNVYKFSLADDLAFAGKLRTSGTSLNQFSFDEDEQGNFRLALNDTVKNKTVTKVEIYNSQLKLLGSLNNLAPGERMYAARFIGSRAYLVTYQTIDPLFVLDLSKPSNPQVLGELKIPGYSTYLHPYDEHHLLGFGIETKEHFNRDELGKIISTRATRESLKIALFDVSKVSEPKQLASTTIGDSLTSSAILTNHKALLFSREKNLLAIPVNYYRSKSQSSKTFLNESYWVYRLSLSDGFTLQGKIIHEANQDCPPSHLLRGLYIRDYLYTLSESTLKVNHLSNLQELATLKFAPEKKCAPVINPVLID